MHTEPKIDIDTDPLDAGAIPECIAKRWAQAERIDRADDWKEAAVFCGDLAITLYRGNGYNPDDPVFQSLCRLGRIAFRRAGSRLAQISARAIPTNRPTHHETRI